MNVRPMPITKWSKNPGIYGEILNGKIEPKAAIISIGGWPIRGGKPYMIIVKTIVPNIPAFVALTGSIGLSIACSFF
jgi:hypothetical protein